MRMVISLLLQNPELVKRMSESGVQALRAEAGFEILEKLTALCRQREGITTGQILEYFRNTSYSNPLEILATWDHLLDESDIINAFSQNYRRLNIQAIERDIEMLIAKERTEGLTNEEKTVLVHLLAGKEQQKKTVSESAITMVESQVHKKNLIFSITSSKTSIKMEKNQQSTAEQYSEQIEQLMELGRTQGYLTFAEINDLLPEDAIDPEYYDKLLQTLQNDAGIPVLDEAPESDDMMLSDTIPDEDAVEEATQILSNVESEIGRTTDPVRMYMREMGTVDLLTREDEISIAKRIEGGIDEVQTSIAAYPEALNGLLKNYDDVEKVISV